MSSENSMTALQRSSGDVTYWTWAAFVQLILGSSTVVVNTSSSTLGFPGILIVRWNSPTKKAQASKAVRGFPFLEHILRRNRRILLRSIAIHKLDVLLPLPEVRRRKGESA